MLLTMDMSDNYDNNSDSVFNFESDHLALRGNHEYSKILRTIALLEAQKMQIHSDIEQIILSKNKYLHNPSSFVTDIFENKFVSPKYICIVPIPDIGQTTNNSELTGENENESKINTDVKVRGRIFDQTKPETFNQLWTCEEQRRLEQLLIEYPVEPVEMRRFAKIALALGNRTPQQVASRVQKFFKKLHSVGMPVPGRIPKNKKNVFAKSKHFYKNVCRPSTFFPAHNVPVNIPDDDMFNVELSGSNCIFDFKSFINTTVEKETLNFKKHLLYMLQTTRKDRELILPEQSINSVEKCESCADARDTESRWLCNTCCCYINICADCILSKILNKTYAHINHDIILNKEI